MTDVDGIARQSSDEAVETGAETGGDVGADTSEASGGETRVDAGLDTGADGQAGTGEEAPADTGPDIGTNVSTRPAPEFRVMDVQDVSLELPAQFPSVTLMESEPPFRSLVFPIGLAEGTALALALRRMTSPRPMTHELFMDVMRRTRIDVVAVRLVGREHGNYLAELDLMAPQGRERVACRPSDGLVMALRMPVSAPILVDVRLLEAAGDIVPLAYD